LSDRVIAAYVECWNGHKRNNGGVDNGGTHAQTEFHEASARGAGRGRRFVRESEFAQLPFLQAIVKEGFRLHPPSPLPILRESLHPCEFRGYKLPAKTILIHNIFSIHRDPSVYENPDEFNPERFLHRPDINPLAHFDSFELVPFGVGRRSTLGNAMVTLMLANLLFRFHWSMPEGLSAQDMDMSEAHGLTVWMKTPLCLVATPRTRLIPKPA
jgi:cytochrome P450